MDKLPSKDIAPTSDAVREWDPTEQKIVTKDRGTYFSDKYVAADRFATKATGFALVAGVAALFAWGAYSNASSTARRACFIVSAVWSEKEAADDDNPAPKWMLSRDTEIDNVFDACVSQGYIE